METPTLSPALFDNALDSLCALLQDETDAAEIANIEYSITHILALKDSYFPE